VLGERLKKSLKKRLRRKLGRVEEKNRHLLRDITQRYSAFGQNQSITIMETQTNRQKKRGGK